VTPTPEGEDDFNLRRIISANAVLSDASLDFREIGVQVRAEGDHVELVRVYLDVIPPGGPSNPGGCLPNGRILDTTLTLDPTGVTAPKNQPVFADTGTLGDGLVEFSCTNQSAVVGQRYTLIAAVDAHGDDLALCGPGDLLTNDCANALFDDDTDSNNRLTRNAPKVKKP
jgi:hypothetical protein